MVREACTAKNFLFFNATATMQQRFGSNPDQLYWRTTDMHFSFTGLAAYSHAVAEFMANNMIKPEDRKE